MDKRLKIKPRRGAWIIVPLALFAFFAPAGTKAEISNPGLIVTVYNNFGYNASPPLPEESGRPVVGTTTVVNIDQNFDADPLFGMYEDFIVKYEGFITSPISGNIVFLPSADDGTKLIIDGLLIDDNWVDKGGWGNPSQPVYFSAGESKQFLYWFYENGGGASTTLFWNIGNGLEVVPPSAFSQTKPTPPTTTIPKFLGKPTNVVLTDTGSGILVDWEAAQNDLGISPERYAISWSTENSGWGIPTGNVGDNNSLDTEIFLDYSLFLSTGGLNAEYIITVRADNDTYSVYSEQSDGQPLLIGINPSPPTTTTTTVAQPITIPESTSTLPKVEEDKIQPEQSTTTTFTTITPQTTTTIGRINEDRTTTTTTEAPVPQPAPDKEGEVEKEEILKSLSSGEISKEIAVAAATSKEVLSEVSKEQSVEIFKEIVISDLSNEEVQKIIEAVQNAPEEVREAFEEEINVFSGEFDTYIPTGSSVDIKTRRVIVAATTVLSTIGISITSGGSGMSGGSGPSSSSGGGSGDGRGRRKQ